MARRTLLAVVLSLLVIVFTPMLFRGLTGSPAGSPMAARDTSAPRDSSAAPGATAAAPIQAPAETQPEVARPAAPSFPSHAQGDTTSVAAAKARYAFTTAGAVPTS